MKTKKQVVRKPKEQAPIVKVSAAPEKPWLLNSEEVTIIKNNVAKGASDEELMFCLTVARRYKLDPFRQQIWFVKRWDKGADNGTGGKGANVWTPQVGINGLLFAAARDHKLDFGSVGLPEYGPMIRTEGIVAPEWARVKIWKKGQSEATEAECFWNEYAPADLSKAPFWKKMPRRMLGKCATALAVRQAYPDLGGLYIPEEMERMGEDFTPNGRQITELAGSDAAAQEVAQRKIQEHKEGKTITIEKEIVEQAPETISVIPWKEGQVALSGESGLAIVRADLTPELIEELGIAYNTKEKVVHMPAANVFKFIDRAKLSNVEANFIDAEKAPEQGNLL